MFEVPLIPVSYILLSNRKYRAENHKALLLEQENSTNSIQIERQYKKDLGELMKPTTPFTILNQKLNEMDYIRNAINSKEKSVTGRLHDDFREMFKPDPCIMNCEKENSNISNRYV